MLINSHWSVKFLRDLSKSEELLAQLWYLRNLDVNSRDLFKETIFGSEILIAYAHAHHANNCNFCENRRVPKGEAYFPEAAVMLNYCLQ